MILIIIYDIIFIVNEKEIKKIMEKRYTLEEINLRIKKLMVKEMQNIKPINKWRRIKKNLYPDVE